MTFERIPAELARLPNWVALQRGKHPYSTNGEPAKADTPSTWNTLQAVREFLKKAPNAYSGAGFVLTSKDNIVCIDVYNCLDDSSNTNSTAKMALGVTNTYVEKSTSGRGLRFLGFGSMPPHTIHFKSPFNPDTLIEMRCGIDEYGNNGDIVTLTTDIISGRTKLTDMQPGIDYFLKYAPIPPAEKEIPPSPVATPQTLNGGSAGKADNEPAQPQIPPAQPPIPPAENKPIFTALNDKGYPIRTSFTNFKGLLDWLDGVHIRYNQLKHYSEISVNGKNYDFDTAVVIMQDYCAKYGLSTSRGNIAGWLALVAKENAYSPVVDYLQDCYIQYKQLSDVYSPIDTLWNTLHLSATAQENEPFLKKLFIKWLVGCVAIAHNDGKTALQGVLVLKGGQGIGKTTFARKLMPSVGSDWFIEGLSLVTNDKDSLVTATTHWLGELGEFSETFRKSHFDSLKQFLTKSVDTIRLPYARSNTTEPRRTAFIATVNDDTFLADKTGNRRYWVLDLESIDLDTPLDVNLLWGAVMALWKQGKELYFLTQAENQKIMSLNRKYEKVSDTEQILVDWLDWGANAELWQWQTPTALCMALGLPLTYARKIGRTLAGMLKTNTYTYLKFERKNTSRLYFLPPAKQSEPP